MRATLALAAALVLPAASDAQLELTRAHGVLGTTLDYALDGDPFELYAFLPSLSQGPTPLSLFDPLDPRVLEVGLDLPAYWVGGLLDASGQAALSYALPASPGSQGLALFAQALTLPGSPTLVDDLSNPTGVVLQGHGTSVFSIGDRMGSIDGHSATVLDDGRVLLAGGVEETSPGVTAQVLDFEVFDPQTQEFAPETGVLAQGRSAHLAVKLLDGRVLLIGGVNASGAVTATCDIWDPATGLATAAASMSKARLLCTADVLPDGRVFVAGGLSIFNEADPFGTIGSANSSTELYDPVANTWSPGPSLPVALIGHKSSVLGSGRVLITAGTQVTFVLGFPFPATTAAARRFDPASGTYLAAASVPGARSDHAQATLPDGRAVITGGQAISGVSVLILGSSAIYDEATNSWTAAAPLVVPRAAPQLVVTAAHLVVQGGAKAIDSVTGAITPADEIERAPHSASVWTHTGDNLLERIGATLAVVDDGERVLTTGTGTGGGPGLDVTAETYAP